MKLSDHWASLVCGALVLVNLACIAFLGGGLANVVAVIWCAAMAAFCWLVERGIRDMKRESERWSR